MNCKILFYFLFVFSFVSFGFSATCSSTLDLSASDYSVTAGGETYDCVYVRSGYTLTVDYPLTVNEEMVVYSGGAVTHSANDGTKLYWVNISAVNLTVESGASIDVTGKGYAGGVDRYSSGKGPGGGIPGDAYDGSGGGHGGIGGTARFAGGDAYGNVVNPLELGSGGGGGQDTSGAAGGGMVILDVSDSLVLNGDITVNGGNAFSDSDGAGGGGSGGSILISTSSLSGSGSIVANGGNGGSGQPYGGGGAGGRIALYYDSNTFSGDYSAYGGLGANYGGIGTVYVKPSGLKGTLYYRGVVNPGTNIDLTSLNDTIMSLNDFNVIFDYTKILIDSSVVTTGDVTFTNSSIVYLRGDLTGEDLVVEDSSVIYVQNRNEGDYSSTNFVFDSVDIASTGNVTGDGLGYAGGTTASRNGNGPGAGTGDGTYDGSGAGHGAYGGQTYQAAGGMYDSLFTPSISGSGAGAGQYGVGGNGGGAISFDVTNGMIINGYLGAIGLNGGSNVGGGGGGGSGGSIMISANSLSGSGVINVTGGNAGTGQSGSGGGAGGMIALYYDSNSYSGSLSACGGTGNYDGGTGTIYIKSSSSSIGTLYYTGCNDAYQNTGKSGLSNSFLEGNSIDIDILSAAILIEDSADVGGDIVVVDSSTIFLRDDLSCSDFSLTDSSTVYVQNDVAGVYDSFTMSFESFTIDSSSVVNADALGYGGGTTSVRAGLGPGGGGSSSLDGGGAGHSGPGGTGNGAAGIGYDSLVVPSIAGSGGGAGQSGAGGDGGGAFIINVSGSFVLNGNLSSVASNGVPNAGGSGAGGSGGSIWVIANAFSGSGSIDAHGGNSGSGQGTDAGGAGGRVAIYYRTNTFTGTILIDEGTGDNDGSKGSLFECQMVAGSYSCVNANGVLLDSTFSQDYAINGTRVINSVWNAGHINFSDDITTNVTYTVSGLNPSVLYLVYEDGVNTHNVTSSAGGSLTTISIDTSGGVEVLIIEADYDPANYVGGSSSSSGLESIFPFAGVSTLMLGLLLLLVFL